MPDDDQQPKLTTWTLGAIKSHNMTLEGQCEAPGCGEFCTFDISGLIESFGDGWLVPEILPAPCPGCGERLKFQLAVHHDEQQ